MALGLGTEPGKQNGGRKGFLLRAGLAGVAGWLEGWILKDAWPAVGEGGDLYTPGRPRSSDPWQGKVPRVTGSQHLGCVGMSRGC